MEEYEFILQDRIAKIQAINKEYDLEHNAYISYSGGKDSTILSHLVDMALPNNNIPRVFLNTGIEYLAIVKFVKKQAEQDKRIIILNSGVNIRKMLEKYGYPFKSKEFSLRVCYFNKGSNANYIEKFLSGYDKKYNKQTSYGCANKLKYIFNEKGKYNYSDRCCYELKKKPAKKWAKQNNRTIVLTGMRAEEGGNRARLGCTIFKNGTLLKFHPLIVLHEDFIDELRERERVELCELYYEPYKFKRTGCKGCPFALNLQDQLDIMDRYLPNEKKQCEILWKPVYDEYRRIGYRLRKNKSRQLTIDEL